MRTLTITLTALALSGCATDAFDDRTYFARQDPSSPYYEAPSAPAPSPSAPIQYPQAPARDCYAEAQQAAARFRSAAPPAEVDTTCRAYGQTVNCTSTQSNITEQYAQSLFTQALLACQRTTY